MISYSQAAKLETILKEVILNAQKDVVSAQKVVKQYQAQIDELNRKITGLEMNDEKHKQELKNLKICLRRTWCQERKTADKENKYQMKVR